MSEEHRKHERHDVHVDVSITLGEKQSLVSRTRDISDGGMFLELNDPNYYPMGELVHIKYKNPFRDNMDTELDAIVVRVSNDGIGIAFVEMGDF